MENLNKGRKTFAVIGVLGLMLTQGAFAAMTTVTCNYVHSTGNADHEMTRAVLVIDREKATLKYFSNGKVTDAGMAFASEKGGIDAIRFSAAGEGLELSLYFSGLTECNKTQGAELRTFEVSSNEDPDSSGVRLLESLKCRCE